MTTNEAKETKIYCIDGYKVKEEILYDFVMYSAEKTTTPLGVGKKLHIRGWEGEQRFELWTWGPNGNSPRKIETFDTEEEAEDDLFRRIYEYDFEQDDQRDTWYAENRESAEEELFSRCSYEWSVDPHVAKSVIRRMNIIEVCRQQKNIEKANIESERVEKLAAIYAGMISPIEGESYKQTANRLSAAIGQRIESKVFHASVRIIRTKKTQSTL